MKWPQNYGIYCLINNGSTYGEGHDFHLVYKSNTNITSYSNLHQVFRIFMKI
jgi:hypothetical protein